MRIGIQTWGSEGDVRPFIALADGLVHSGNKVTLVISTDKTRNYQENEHGVNNAIKIINEVFNI